MFIHRQGTLSSGNTCEAFILRWTQNCFLGSEPLPSFHLMPLPTATRGWCSIAEAALPGGPCFLETTLSVPKTPQVSPRSPKMLVCHHVQPVLVLAQWYLGEPIIVTGLETCSRVRRAILPQVKDPPISTSVQKWVIPLNILPALNYLYLQLLITASEWFGLMDPCQCTANLNLNPCKLHPHFSSEKGPIGLPLVMQKPHLFVVSLFVCLFWICCLKTLLGKCRKNIGNK